MKIGFSVFPEKQLMAKYSKPPNVYFYKVVQFCNQTKWQGVKWHCVELSLDNYYYLKKNNYYYLFIYFWLGRDVFPFLFTPR